MDIYIYAPTIMFFIMFLIIKYKKNKINERIICICEKEEKTNLVLGYINIIISVFFIYLYLKEFKINLNYLVPTHIEKWNDMFNYRQIYLLKEEYLKDEKLWYETIQLIFYLDDLKCLYIGIGTMLGGIISIYSEKIIVYETFIWLKYRKIQSNDIVDYVLKENYDKDNNIKNYKLILSLNYNRFKRKLYKKANYNICIHINVSDKDKVLKGLKKVV